MFAVIETGGKQYRVSPGDTLRVETIPFKAGESVELGGLIAVGKDDGSIVTGEDVANAKVLADIVGEGRADKVIVFKFKRKKQYKRTYGHRQNYTEVKVSGITL